MKKNFLIFVYNFRFRRYLTIINVTLNGFKNIDLILLLEASLFY